MNKVQKQSGLTLIELSIGMVVIGLLLVAYFQYDEIKTREHLKSLGNYKSFTIADGLAKYRVQHGRLPCPAPMNLPFDDSNYGVPVENLVVTPSGTKNDCNTTDVDPALVVVSGTCGHGYCVTSAVNSDGNTKRIRIGAIPYKVLGIGAEDVIDIHGNQYQYAVVEEQASASTPYTQLVENADGSRDNDENHVITINDFDLGLLNSSGVPTTPGSDRVRISDVLFFSAGKNGAGSHTKEGNANLQPCPTSGTEAENCNNDAVFVTDKYAYNSSSAVTADFDDSLVYDLREWLYIWDVKLDDQESIYTLLDGNMGVGVEQSTEKVHVMGNLRVDMLGNETAPNPDFGKIQTEIICDQTASDCFSPEHLGGPEEDPNTLHCSDKDNYPVMRGVQLTSNSDVKARQLEDGTGCIPFVGTDTENCSSSSAFHFMTGLTIDATTGQITRRCANILN